MSSARGSDCMITEKSQKSHDIPDHGGQHWLPASRMCLEPSDHSKVISKKMRGHLSSEQAGPGIRSMQTLHLSPLACNRPWSLG